MFGFLQTVAFTHFMMPGDFGYRGWFAETSRSKRPELFLLTLRYDNRTCVY